jgi:hypothetical protein
MFTSANPLWRQVPVDPPLPSAGTDSVTTSDLTSYWFSGGFKVDDKERKMITSHYHQVSTTIITAAAEDFKAPSQPPTPRLEICFPRLKKGTGK